MGHVATSKLINREQYQSIDKSISNHYIIQTPPMVSNSIHLLKDWSYDTLTLLNARWYASCEKLVQHLLDNRTFTWTWSKIIIILLLPLDLKDSRHASGLPRERANGYPQTIWKNWSHRPLPNRFWTASEPSSSAFGWPLSFFPISNVFGMRRIRGKSYTSLEWAETCQSP